MSGTVGEKFAAVSAAADFQVDVFAQTSAEERQELAPLSWRDDKEVSLSDWTLIIATASSCTSASTIKEYHVHRTSLATGVRGMDYFKVIFRGLELSEHGDSISRIELRPSAAAAVDALLDFVYGLPLAATTGSAVALLHLAQYFRGRAAHDAVAHFVKGDLNSSTAPTYLAEATIYGMEQIAAEAFRLCVANLGAPTSLVVGAMDMLEPETFLRVLQSPALKCDSKLLSLHVASFCRGKTIDASLLRELTPATLMPEVSPSVSFPLLQLALKHEILATEAQPGLPTLQGRCIRAAASSFREVFGQCCVAAVDSPAVEAPAEPAAKRARVESELIPLTRTQLPSEVKISIFEGALAQAHTELDAQKEVGMKLQAQVKDLQETTQKQSQVLRGFVRVPKTASFGLGDEKLASCVHSTAGETRERAGTYHYSTTAKYTAPAPSFVPPSQYYGSQASPEGWTVALNEVGVRDYHYGAHVNRSVGLYYYSG